MILLSAAQMSFQIRFSNKKWLICTTFVPILRYFYAEMFVNPKPNNNKLHI